MEVRQILLSSSLSKNININSDRTIILPVLCGCETWSLTLREEGRVRVPVNIALGEYLSQRGTR